MRHRPLLLAVCLAGGLHVWAGTEYLAKPGEDVVANEFIVHLMPGATATTLVAKYVPGAQIQALAHDRFFRIRIPGGLSAGVSARIAADLQVDFVEPNRIRHAVVAAPNDPNYGSSWWFPAVQALQAWSLLPGQYTTAATAGTGRVKVAVLDTGADCTHPDFVNTGGNSTDSAQGGQLMFSASQAIVHTTIANPVCPWQDDHGHGTHVTGIVAAATSNGIGVSGLGYPVQVIEYKVLNSAGSGNDTDIMNAIEAAANAGAQVVSMSLGGVGYSPTLQTAINYAWQHNTLVVSAAGNDGSNELFFPAGANHAVGVSATDSGNNSASFSNFGNAVQLAAPGVGILSTTPTYSASQGWPLNYASLSGTSMATPFVAALAGLVGMTTPNATAAAILQRMEQTASSVTAGGGWNQNFGFGLISASGAVAGTLRAAVNGAITGQILDQFGNPISGAQITINSQTITTDPTGSNTTGLYRFPTLPAGTYAVTISAPNKPTQSLSATVAPGADTPFTVTMGVTYSKFTGTVTDQGLGVSGAIVQSLSGGLITAVAIADQSGQYTLWVPGSGTYDVRASQIGRVTTTLTGLTLSPGGTTTANLTLPRMGTIAGSVRDVSQNPVANVRVLVTGGTFSAAAATDSNGNYSLIGVPAGTQFSATATATGFVASTQNAISVAADITTNVNFTMVSSTVAAPTFLPPGGTYSTAQSVTISTATVGASIRYTTDGSVPTSSMGTLYNSNTPVSVSSNLTLRAIAYMTGMTDSAVASAAYTITSGGGGSNLYNPSWTNRKAVTIDHTKVSGGSSLTNFAVLFSTTDVNLKTVANGGSVGKSDGSDILFTAGDGTTRLDHELERYNASTGEVIAWVRIPSLSNTTDTALYIYYGNAAAANQQNPTGVWDSSYKGIWHLPNGTVLNASDSTANAHNGSIIGAGARAGEIDGAGSFSGSSQYININNFAIPDPYNFTVEAWINPTDFADYDGIVGKTNSYLPAPFDLYLNQGNGLPVFYVGDGGSHYSNLTGTSAPATGAWSHIVMVSSGSSASVTLTQYLNGATNGSTTLTSFTAADTNNSIKIASRNDIFTMFKGGIDEVRISAAPRSAGWITTEYSNQHAPSTFLAIGAQESSGGSQAVAAPTFLPPAGTYTGTQNVTISTTTSGASIRYTTDGSMPTSSMGTVYNSNTPVSVSSNLTLRAIAYMTGMADSAVTSGTYTITGQVSVPMSQYNFDRTGANLSEQVLNTSNVNPAQFGKLFSRALDDSEYGLPLIIPSLAIAGGVHDVMFVATMNNSVYAFDAVDPAHTQPYWSVNLGHPGVGSTFIGPVNFGILSTPFIDTSTNTMYVVAEIQNGTDVGLYIFALDITTGQPKYNSPRRMSFTFPVEGITLTNVAGAIQRAGLLVSNGVLYVAVANVVPNDYESQEGFVQSFDAHNLSNQLGIFESTPSATEGKGGIWEAGRGLPVDASGVYFSVAGGAYSSTANPPNFGSSIVRVAASTLSVQDWFAPQNWQYLFANNIDPAAGGVTLIPGTSLLFAGGKEGVIYLLNRNTMGHLEGTDGQPVQRFQASYGCAQNTAAPDCAQTLGTSYWDRGGSGMLYVWDKTDVLRAYSFNGQTFNAGTPQVGTLAVGMTGGPSLSANGADLSSAIVWAVTTTNSDSNTPSAGTLRAFRADNITQELYNSDVNQGGDSLGTMTKFAPPVVANGRVYVSTQSNAVQVYGLLFVSRTAQTITFGPLANQTVGVAPFTIVATASSGLPVSFNSLTVAVCTVAGNSVTILAVGTCSVQATQTGNATYSAATPVVQSFVVNPASPVATPTFAPPAGTYSTTQSVTISTTTSNASIRYTTDGTTPTSSMGTLYNSNTPVSVSSNLTLRAIAYMTGMADSAVASAAYTITSGGGGSNWYNPSWTNRKAVTIDHTKVSGGSSLTNFAVLFSTTDVNLKTVANGGSVGKSDGSDILFTAGDGTTRLDHELERYNASTGEVIAWVRIPSLSNTTDTALYIYYGNAAAANQQNPTGVWDSSYKGIWHLPNGSVLSASDSTANANNGSIVGAGAGPGEIGGAGTFSGSSQYVNINNFVIPDPYNFTVEAWINPTNFANYDGIVGKTNSNLPGPFDLYLNQGDGRPVLYIGDGGSHYSNLNGTSAPGTGVWSHIVVVSSGSSASVTLTQYLNGATNGTTTLTSFTAADTNNNIKIASRNDLVTMFKGGLDEVRISSAPRSAGWITTEYSNQHSPSTFLAIGAQESSGGSQAVAAPTFLPPAGTYSTTQMVTISTTTSNASIRYTTDGSIPTSSMGTLYNSNTPVSVSSNLTLRAIAYETGMTDSTATSGTYIIQVAPPTFNPPAGTYGSTQSVTISTTTSNASIRYTTDGSAPTSSMGTLYNSNTPVSVSSNLTLRAIAYMTGMADSAVASAAYTITSGGGGSNWYNPSWTNRKAVTIDHTKVSGGSSLANFAVLFSTTDVNLKTVANGGSVGKSDGSDILFTAGDGTTRLDHELERYNASTGEVIAWVRIPSLSNTTDTALYIYYGNAAAANQQNPTGVWDSSYKGIWHLPNGSVLSASDSTANANNGSIVGAGAGPGEIGGAGTFSGSSQYVNINNFVIPDPYNFTVEAWINPTNFANYDGIVGKTNSNLPGPFDLYLNQGDGRPVLYIGDGGSHYSNLNGTSAPGTGVWSHIVVVSSGSSASVTLTQYLNGATNGTTTLTSFTAADTNNNIKIASRNDLVTMFKGGLDEVRISSAPRSAGWITTEYSNQHSPSTFLAIGAQESM